MASPYKNSDAEGLSALTYFRRFMLAYIPFVNIVAGFIWAVGSTDGETRKFGRGLLFAALAFTCLFALLALFGYETLLKILRGLL